MLTIERTAEIAAIPDQVWRALTDFESYPGWIPFVRVEGEEGLLEPVIYRFKVRHSGKTERLVGFPGRIETYEPTRELVFLVGFPTLLRLTIGYRLEPAGARTRVSHAITISGLAPLLARRHFRKLYTPFAEGALGALQRRFSARGAASRPLPAKPPAPKKRKAGPRTRRSRP